MFGTNVALSADGNTALIGGWNDDSVASGNLDYSGKGAAWVFTRSGSTWSQQGRKLTGRGERERIRQVRHDRRALRRRRHRADRRLERRHQQGRGVGVHPLGRGVEPAGAEAHRRGRDRRRQVRRGVALSADGDRALIGALYDNSTRGAAWVFTRSGSTWTQQGGKLTGGGGAGEERIRHKRRALRRRRHGADRRLARQRRHGRGVGLCGPAHRDDRRSDERRRNQREPQRNPRCRRLEQGVLPVRDDRGLRGLHSPPRALASPAARVHSRPSSAGLRRERPTTSDSSPKTPVEWPTAAIRRLRAKPEAHPPKESPPRRPNPTPRCRRDPETSLPPAVQHARQSATRWREGNRLARISRAKTPMERPSRSRSTSRQP